MLLRALAIISISMLAMSGFTGCTCPESYGAKPPKFKMCQMSRLSDEFAWFYASFNDVVLGIDYYQDMNDKFGSSPY